MATRARLRRRGTRRRRRGRDGRARAASRPPTDASGVGTLALPAGSTRAVAAKAGLVRSFARAGDGAREAARAPLLAAALLLGGCGLGAGEEQEGGARLRVTRDFGHERARRGARDEDVREDQTVMRLLQLATSTWRPASAGASSQSIDGLEGGGAGGQRDWFFFVNGIEAEVGAAEYELSPGDLVQWDYRDWDARDARARDRRRLPRAVPATGSRASGARCAWSASDAEPTACRDVKDALERAGVPASRLVARGAGHRERDPRGGRALGRARATCAAPRRSRRGPRRAACSRASRGRPRARAARRGRRRGAHRARRRRHRAGGGACGRAPTSCVWLVTGLDDAGRAPPACARSTRARCATPSPSRRPRRASRSCRWRRDDA